MLASGAAGGMLAAASGIGGAVAAVAAAASGIGGAAAAAAAAASGMPASDPAEDDDDSTTNSGVSSSKVRVGTGWVWVQEWAGSSCDSNSGTTSCSQLSGISGIPNFLCKVGGGSMGGRVLGYHFVNDLKWSCPNGYGDK
eukprot:514304-Alexandrium_andersonii.AAC.1